MMYVVGFYTLAIVVVAVVALAIKLEREKNYRLTRRD